LLIDVLNKTLYSVDKDHNIFW